MPSVPKSASATGSPMNMLFEVEKADEKTPEWSESILKMRTKMRLAKKTSQIEMKGTIIGSNSAKRSSCVIFSITLEKRKQGSERKVTKRTRSCEAV